MTNQKKKILVVTDTDMMGSGYFNIAVPLCQGLAKLGHEIKFAGLNYNGEEHNFDFSVIPARSFQEINAIVTNFVGGLWKFDVMLVALDIPQQISMLNKWKERDFKYVAVFPIESDPLSFAWSMSLSSADKLFCISKFGTAEAEKVYLPAEYFEVSIDDKWRVPTAEEKSNIREAYGVGKNDFVVLTVAANQERKNLQAAVRAFSNFAKDKDDVHYAILTAQNFFAGWNLDDLSSVVGCRDKMMLIEKGLDFPALWQVYAMSDVFLLPSKAEGAGLPILEAMATGLPVIGTRCTSFMEHLEDGRGFLVDSEYEYIDVFGNGWRYMADIGQITNTLEHIYEGDWVHNRDAAVEYVKSRSWDKTVERVDEALQEL